MKGDSLKGSSHTPMYNPHILSLSTKNMTSEKTLKSTILENLKVTPSLPFVLYVLPLKTLKYIVEQIYCRDVQR